jgi:hypothetical protein
LSGLRSDLIRLLGGFSPSRFSVVSSEPAIAGAGCLQASELRLRREDGVMARAILTGPEGAWRAAPAAVYCHAHGANYALGAAELLLSRPALQAEPYAPALARLGVVALSIDMPCFGSRAGETESAASKRMLWRGKTLFGEMLEDLAGAIAVLQAMPGIDGDRIGVCGVSMGATQAFWLAALDERIRCLAHLCCFADLAELVRLGVHDLHGIYMMVPGLLPLAHTGEIAGLAAPRPQLACMGRLDPLTPSTAIGIAVADLRAAYEARNAAEALQVIVDDQAGHKETPAMREAVLRFFSERL